MNYNALDTHRIYQENQRGTKPHRMTYQEYRDAFIADWCTKNAKDVKRECRFVCRIDELTPSEVDGSVENDLAQVMENIRYQLDYASRSYTKFHYLELKDGSHYYNTDSGLYVTADWYESDSSYYVRAAAAFEAHYKTSDYRKNSEALDKVAKIKKLKAELKRLEAK